MRKIVLFCIIILCILPCYGQEALLPKGKVMASAGYGVIFLGMETFPVSVDVGVWDNGERASLGAGLSIIPFYERHFAGYQDGWITLKTIGSCITPQVTFHFTLIKKWEIFAGTGAGLYYQKQTKLTTDTPDGTLVKPEVTHDYSFQVHAFAGTRVQFGNHFGLYIQADYPFVAHIGLSWRF
ncbi:MAG: hypothetical protein WC910_09280 [Bacteroidales bacterium]|jgi:hypothetical protein